jgi:hypothetical protein
MSVEPYSWAGVGDAERAEKQGMLVADLLELADELIVYVDMYFVEKWRLREQLEELRRRARVPTP